MMIIADGVPPPTTASRPGITTEIPTPLKIAADLLNFRRNQPDRPPGPQRFIPAAVIPGIGIASPCSAVGPPRAAPGSPVPTLPAASIAGLQGPCHGRRTSNNGRCGPSVSAGVNSRRRSRRCNSQLLNAHKGAEARRVNASPSGWKNHLLDRSCAGRYLCGSGCLRGNDHSEPQLREA